LDLRTGRPVNVDQNRANADIAAVKAAADMAAVKAAKVLDNTATDVGVENLNKAINDFFVQTQNSGKLTIITSKIRYALGGYKTYEIDSTMKDIINDINDAIKKDSDVQRLKKGINDYLVTTQNGNIIKPTAEDILFKEFAVFYNKKKDDIINYQEQIINTFGKTVKGSEEVQVSRGLINMEIGMSRISIYYPKAVIANKQNPIENLGLEKFLHNLYTVKNIALSVPTISKDDKVNRINELKKAINYYLVKTSDPSEQYSYADKILISAFTEFFNKNIII
jgi:hypothetical protein